MPTDPATPPVASPAARLRHRRWRDPRLAMGAVIVATSVLLGSWVLASEEELRTVWAAREPLPEGVRVEQADLEPRQLRVQAGAERYVAATNSVVGRVLARDVGAGELLPVAALAASSGTTGLQVPLTVDAGALPGAVRSGSVVDVWVTPRDPEPGGTRARRVLAEAVVLEAPPGSDPLAPVATRSVLLAVTADDAVAEVLGAAADGRVVLVLRGQR